MSSLTREGLALKSTKFDASSPIVCSIAIKVLSALAPDLFSCSNWTRPGGAPDLFPAGLLFAHTTEPVVIWTC